MTKSFFESYINAEPTTMEEKYIFLIDSQDLVEATIVTGYRALLLIENEELYFNAESFTTYLKQIEFSGKYEKDLIYVPACLSKKLNDKLKEYFEKEQFSCHEGWKLFKNCEYLSKSEFQDELKKKLVSFIERFEGANKISTDLAKFHHHNANGEATGVFDFAIFEHIKANYNIFVCGGTPYIYQEGFYRADVSGARLKTIIRELIYPQFIKARTINNIYMLFLQDMSLEMDFEQLNNYPSHWICFRNGMYDAKKQELLPHSPKYMAINQIPHNFSTKCCKGEKIEEYLNFICEEADCREMLLQFIGYSLTKDVSQQRFLMLRGEGGSGKSIIIRLLESLVGSHNISNISLANLEERFSSFGLMGKLLNSCADLEIKSIEETSMLKKILGEDTLRAEQKGKDAISFKSYAKLMFSVNELPIVKSEKTNGFYRRLLVLTINKPPTEVNPNLFQELEEEIEYLLQLVVKALERMYEQKIITISNASKKAVLQLRADSDTTEAFLQEFCVNIENGRIERTELYNTYNKFCEDTDRQSLTKNNFYRALRTKGYLEIKTGGYRYFKGIEYQKNCPKLPQNSPQFALEDDFVTVTQEQMKEVPFNLE